MKTVAVDACVLIEAVRSQTCPKHPLRAQTNPAHFLLTLAERHIFDLVLLPLVMAQVQDNLSDGEYGFLLPRLNRSRCIHLPQPTREEIATVYAEAVRLRSTVRDVDDWEIAASVYLANPDYFISSNTSDFNHTFDDCLRGTRVTTPKLFVAHVIVELQADRAF